MRLTMDSFVIPAVPTVVPADAQSRLVALIAEHGDMGRAAAALIAEAHAAQRKLAQRHLTQSARDMDEAIEEVRREQDWLSIGDAAKLIRIRRATLHAAVMAGEIRHIQIVVRGIPARHVQRGDVLDWHEDRERARRATLTPASSAA